MKIAFYYHIPVKVVQNKVLMPGFLGVFVDSLANYTNTLTLIMHQAIDGSQDETACDYTLQSPNINLVNLGHKKPAWHRSYFHASTLKNKLRILQNVDAFIVRSPTPLAPYFHHYINRNKIVFMIVGDYAESVLQSASATMRNKLVNLYLKQLDKTFMKEIKRTNCIVNSPALFHKYEKIAPNIQLTKTTTLSAKDFFTRKQTCTNQQLNILYTGRFDFLKGLRELIDAVALVKRQYKDIKLHLAGWESDAKLPVTTYLQQKVNELNLEQNVVWHGKKKIGSELNELYRLADIYVIPSYEEGFPRTIWEAMANSVPVIATNVGAIPYYLRDKESALIIPPKNTDAIKNAMIELIDQPLLREKLIHNGQQLAKENTLEFQTQHMLSIIKAQLQNKNQ